MQVKLRWIAQLNYYINFLVILYFSSLIAITTIHICNSFQARSFLTHFNTLPIIPWRVPLYAMVLMIGMGISNYLKKLYFENVNNKKVVYCLLFDLAICTLLVYFLNFSYKGIYLLLIANILRYLKNNTHRFMLIAPVLILYVILDYDVLSNPWRIFSVNAYVLYYPVQTRFWIQSIKNILVSLNDIGFIIFLVVLLQSKIQENSKMRILNQQLRTLATDLELANMKLKDYAETAAENSKIRERNRLAREIHDILGHSLTSIATGVQAAVVMIDTNVSETKIQLLRLLDLSRKGLQEVRRSVKELHVDALQQNQLIPSIESLIVDLQSCTNINVSLKVEGRVLRLHVDEEQTIYRIVRESLTNAIRHGQATEINLLLSYRHHEVLIEVIDNGIGTDHITKGFGLSHMTDQVERLMGSIHMETQVGTGFKLVVILPIRWGEAYD